MVILSEALLEGTEATWLKETREVIIGLSLRVRILVTTLLMVV